MTNTQSQETQKGLVHREIMHSPNLTEFYNRIWGRYHETNMRHEKRQMPVDKVMVGLGLSALLSSCASQDTYAVRPEAFQSAYTPKETPAELEAKVAGMKKQVNEIKDINNSLDQLTSVASGETTAEVAVPEKNNDPYGLNPMHYLVFGATILGGAVVTYILWPPKKKTPKQSNPPTNAGGQ